MKVRGINKIIWELVKKVILGVQGLVEKIVTFHFILFAVM